LHDPSDELREPDHEENSHREDGSGEEEVVSKVAVSQLVEALEGDLGRESTYQPCEDRGSIPAGLDLFCAA
jgi:hypothetical protein